MQFPPIPPGASGTNGIIIPRPPDVLPGWQVQSCYDETIEHGPSLGTAYVPGESARPARVENDFRLGWNAGARSSQSFVSSGGFKFKPVGPVIGAYAGLATSDPDAGYANMSHAIYFSSGKFQLSELGVLVGAASARSMDDVFAIEQNNGVVTFMMNGVALRTSPVPGDVGSPTFLDVSLYSGGDGITAWQTEGSSVNAMRAFAGTSGEGLQHNTSVNEMRQLTGGGREGTKAINSMRQMAGLAGRSYGAATNAIRPLTGEAYAERTLPNVCVVRSMFMPLSGAGNMLTGGIGSSTGTPIGFLTGMSSDRPYGAASAYIAPLVGWSGEGDIVDDVPNGAAMTLPAFVCTSAGRPANDFGLKTTLPRLRIRSAGTRMPKQMASIVMPRLKVASYGGAVCEGTLPPLVLSTSTTTTEVARATLTIPAFVLSSRVITGGVGRVSARLPASRGGSFGGANTSGELPALRISASALTGAVASVRGVLPALRMTAGGVVGEVGYAALTLPALRMGRSGSAKITLHALMLSASAATSFAAVYEAYALNMSGPLDGDGKNDQLTRYTNYPFTRIVNFRGVYYGIAADGVYALTGSTDQGAAIHWAFRTCLTDFGMPTKKSVPAMYFGGQLGPHAQFTVQCGELPDKTHDYTTTREALRCNHREKFGLGRVTRYYALGVAGEGELNLDSLEFDVRAATRRI